MPPKGPYCVFVAIVPFRHGAGLMWHVVDVTVTTRQLVTSLRWALGGICVVLMRRILSRGDE